MVNARNIHEALACCNRDGNQSGHKGEMGECPSLHMVNYLLRGIRGVLNIRVVLFKF